MKPAWAGHGPPTPHQQLARMKWWGRASTEQEPRNLPRRARQRGPRNQPGRGWAPRTKMRPWDQKPHAGSPRQLHRTGQQEREGHLSSNQRREGAQGPPGQTQMCGQGGQPRPASGSPRSPPTRQQAAQDRQLGDPRRGHRGTFQRLRPPRQGAQQPMTQPFE